MNPVKKRWRTQIEFCMRCVTNNFFILHQPNLAFQILFHEHAEEPVMVNGVQKRYSKQQYDPKWEQIWWHFWCTEMQPSGKASA